jgi:hypothetical protein
MAEPTGQSSQLFPVTTGRNAQFLATVTRSTLVRQVDLTLGARKPGTSQCVSYVVTTFTNIYRGSQLVMIASVYTYQRLFPFKTDTDFLT